MIQSMHLLPIEVSPAAAGLIRSVPYCRYYIRHIFQYVFILFL